MTLTDIVMLGDPRLHMSCAPVAESELAQVAQWAPSMDGVILQFRKRYGAGRAIAAPQLGIMKRLVCMHIDQPVVMINPVLSSMSEEMFELWDDCMSFPDLYVKVRRHKSCELLFRDLQWKEHRWQLEDDLSELLQHEVDHLDGILAIDRAVDNRSLRWRNARTNNS